MKENFKIKIFKVISILLPILLLLILEILLRAFHLTPSLDLFITYPENENYYVFNPHYSECFFSKRQSATRGFYEPFEKKKNSNTLRIFVQGASTAVGFPYFHNGSFHRMLKYRLEQTYPGKEFEIINLSLTAVNSYTLVDQAKEIIKQKPDAILIYAGHNEYYGALGVASSNSFLNSPMSKRLLIQLNKLSIVRVLKSIAYHPRENNEEQTHQNLMLKMAVQKEIRKDSKKYIEGLKQFESNMDILLKQYSKNNIPVFISTLASNEKDLAPFISLSQLRNDSVQIENILISAQKYLQSSDTLKAEKEYLKALSIDSTYARTHFLLGKLFLSQNENGKAKEHLEKAKDYDGLRFRAPSEINRTIERLAEKFQAQLVDAKSELEENSKHKIIGEKLMLEHLHPNLIGYSLISDAFYNSIIESQLVKENMQEIGYKDFSESMPLTVVDSLLGVYSTQVMKANWPFNEPVAENIFGESKSELEEIAGMLTINQITWDVAMEELYKYYQSVSDASNAIVVAEATVLEHPLNDILAAKAGQLNAKVDNFEKAVFYYKKAFGINHSPKLARLIAQNLIQIQSLEEAKKYLEYSSENDKTDKISARAIIAINEILAIEGVDIELAHSEQAYISLSMNYLKLGKNKEAYNNFLLAKSLSPDNPVIRDLEAKVFSKYEKTKTSRNN